MKRLTFCFATKNLPSHTLLMHFYGSWNAYHYMCSLRMLTIRFHQQQNNQKTSMSLTNTNPKSFPRDFQCSWCCDAVFFHYTCAFLILAQHQSCSRHIHPFIYSVRVDLSVPPNFLIWCTIGYAMQFIMACTKQKNNKNELSQSTATEKRN